MLALYAWFIYSTIKIANDFKKVPVAVGVVDGLALYGKLLRGVASMEQMEQLLPRSAQDHFCNSCRSDEIFRRVWVGVG